MTYLADESSVSGSQPVELYKFAGTYASYYYTSGPQPVVYGGNTYEPIDIERAEVKVGTQDDDNLDCVVKMAVFQQVVVDYGFTTSPPRLTLTIYRVQPSGVGIYWVGPVNNISVDDQGRASLRCPSALGNALVGNVPNVYYQKPCNNVLYDERCQVPYADNSYVTTVTSIDPTNSKLITIGGVGTLDAKLIGGELALGTGEVRMIVAQTGDVLTVNFPFNTITPGGACTIAAGCDHIYGSDCKLKFANQQHFNGFMFIPPDNPFTTGIDPAAQGVADTACSFVHSNLWAEIIVTMDWGPLVGIPHGDTGIPHTLPGWGFNFYRGASLEVSADGVDNPAIINGPNIFGEYISFSVPFYNLDGPSGAHLYATDPFAAGWPDKITSNMQWTYPEFSFPEGTGLATVQLKRGGVTKEGIVTVTTTAGAPYIGSAYARIEGLWPLYFEFSLT